MQKKTVTKRYRITTRVDESVYLSLKSLLTHRGQQNFEVEQAIIDRVEKLKKLNSKIAS